MTDREWIGPWNDLKAAGLTGWPQDEADRTARGKLYRARLDKLSPKAWRYAVDLAIDTERYFPTIAVLLACAERYREPEKQGSRDRDKEVDRETAKRGLERIREILKKQGLDPGEPAKEMP